MINTTVISFDGISFRQKTEFSMRMQTSFFFISSVFCSFGYVSNNEVFIFCVGGSNSWTTGNLGEKPAFEMLGTSFNMRQTVW